MNETQLQRIKQRYNVVGNCDGLNRALEIALKIAPVDLSVLIMGENGVGKGVFPRIIHENSLRKNKKYFAVNCGAIPEGTIDSELFGHEKGAFTGAISSRKGYFEEADGGTIFLDEVAELPLTTQARLLRVLESGEFLKVGSSTVQRTNIRVVAATNVDMAKAVAEGRFRQDLYYRLSTVQINVPPLRDRGSDITLLARKFAADFSERYSTPEISLSDDARTLLASYRWPGNVRQLKNVVEQLSLFEAGDEITRERLQKYLPAATFSPVVAAAAAPNDPSERSYAREREVLFNMIFRLREEVDSLRAELSEKKTAAPAMAAVTSAAMVPATQPQPPISHHRALINLPEETAATEVETLQEIVIPAIKTLEDTEKETIRESLERNGGRRKAAAAELRISERTLYRKIKEYGLE